MNPLIIAILVTALLGANTRTAAADLAAIGQGMELLGAGPDHLRNGSLATSVGWATAIS